ncbi:MAG: TonB-dependent receptor domain-containing protein [bacterium]
MYIQKSILAAALSASLFSTAFAAKTVDGQSVQEPIVVTANRAEQNILDVLASITIVDRDDIEQSGAQDILALLSQQAGLDIARTGGDGQQTSIFMRGTNSNHVLVLIDGVRTNSAHTGGFSWEHLSLSQIERIEIVRGPRASVYGSDAIGGVIQIFTRNGTSAELTAGSYDTLKAAASLSTGAFAGAVSYQNEGGFSAQNENGFSFNPDDDGYKNTSLSTRWKQDGLSAQLYYMNAETEFDEGVSNADLLILAAGYSGEVNENWQYNVKLSWLDDKLETPAFFSKQSATRSNVDFINQMHVEAGELQFGLNYQHEKGTSTTYQDRRDNSALFVQLSGGDQMNYQLAARYDSNSEFGSKATGQAAIGYQVKSGWNVFASVGSGFRTPSLSEQFSPGFFGLFAGNPELNPEQSVSYEVGSRWQLSDRNSLTANLYRTDVDDLINFSGGDTFQAINIDKARLEGLELVYAMKASQWEVTANATFQNAENKETGARLLRRADQKLAVDLSYDWTEKLNLYSQVQYIGERDDFGAKLDSYTLLNASIAYQLTPQWKAAVRLDNLTDEDYALAYGYNTPGRSAYLTIQYQPHQ